MFSGIKKLFGAGDSKSVAKSRLQFVLVQDRAGLGNDEIAQFKKDMISVIERYFVIDEQGFDISYKRDKESTTLLINSPIIVRRADTPDHKVGAKHNKNKAAKIEGAASSA